MAKKKVSPLRQEFQKQQRRIRDFMRRAEKRGYTFEGFEIPQMPKRVTKASVERLKELTAIKLYGKAQYTVPVSKDLPEAFVISGKKGRQLERKIAAQKGQETKKKRLVAVYKYDEDTGEITGRPIPGVPKESEIILNALSSLIEQYPSKGADIMKKALAFEIEKYGQEAVAAAMQNVPEDVIKDAENFLHYSGGERTAGFNSSAIRKLTEAIKQTILSGQEMQSLNRIMSEYEGE